MIRIHNNLKLHKLACAEMYVFYKTISALLLHYLVTITNDALLLITHHVPASNALVLTSSEAPGSSRLSDICSMSALAYTQQLCVSAA